MRRQPTNYFLEIQLMRARIPVWRILEVKRTTTLHDLHLCIQVAMGWETEHLYEFTIHGELYGFPFPDNMDDPYAEFRDSNKFRLMDLNLKTGDTFQYLYDFGDHWEHEVVVKAFAKDQNHLDTLPVCRAGAMACPPENIGGIAAFNALVDFRMFRTPIEINPELQQIFKDFDIYDAEIHSPFTFANYVKHRRRYYQG